MESRAGFLNSVMVLLFPLDRDARTRQRIR
jgi:hypothetical protein